MWNRVLSIILVITIMGALGVLGYVIATLKVGEKFRELRVGEEGRVIVGIINREHATVSYWVEVKIDGVKNNQVETVTLEHEEGWEEIVSFTPDRAGDSQTVEFLLYKNGEGEPYLEPLRLWLDVME
ncbi:MAG: DUF1616 domain-containing protein [Dehalococcoidales bacterium]|nr:DUF1616 domain-containing protein [Dehalococcoidales bacterium]